MTKEERSQLQQDYVYELVEGMDHKVAFYCLINYMNDNLNEYTDEELLTEVKDTHPHLLENETRTNDPRSH